MTSKTSNYDNNPNSIFGASKRVVATYNKKVNPSSVSTSSFSSFPQGDKTITPFQQGQKSKPKSEVVNNLNEFTSLIKTITLGLNNVDTYLTTQASDEAVQGSGMYRYRGGMKPTNRQQAYNYIVEKYRDAPSKTKISEEDKKILKKFGLVDSMKLQNTKLAPKIMKLVDDYNPDGVPEESVFIKASSSKASSGKASVAYAEDEDDEADDDFRRAEGEEALNAYAEEAPRFTERPNYPDIFGGDPEADTAQAKEQDTAFRRWRAPPDASQLSGSDDEGSGNEDTPMMGYKPIATYGSEGNESGSDSGDIDPDTELEDVIAKGKKSVITENYLITLITAIINQINKAQDIWEQNISVNLTFIPKIKMDSFVNSKTIKDFEDIIKKLEDTATKTIIKKFYNFLDKVFSKLIQSLDEIFNVLNLDIKKYSSGVYISGGFVPLKTGYNPFVNASMSKYLM